MTNADRSYVQVHDAASGKWLCVFNIQASKSANHGAIAAFVQEKMEAKGMSVEQARQLKDDILAGKKSIAGPGRADEIDQGEEEAGDHVLCDQEENEGEEEEGEEEEESEEEETKEEDEDEDMKDVKIGRFRRLRRMIEVDD